MDEAPTTVRSPEAPVSTDSTLMLQLLQETRDDVKKLVANAAAAGERLTDLERRADVTDKRLADAPAAAGGTNLKRDAGLAAGTSALVVGVIQALSALGWLHTSPAQAAPPAPAPITAAP